MQFQTRNDVGWKFLSTQESTRRLCVARTGKGRKRAARTGKGRKERLAQEKAEKERLAQEKAEQTMRDNTGQYTQIVDQYCDNFGEYYKSHGKISSADCKSKCDNDDSCIVYNSKSNEFCSTYSQCNLKSGNSSGGSLYKKNIRGTANEVGEEFSTVKVKKPTMTESFIQHKKDGVTFKIFGDTKAKPTICYGPKRPTQVRITGCPQESIDYDEAEDKFICNINKTVEGECEIKEIAEKPLTLAMSAK